MISHVLYVYFFGTVNVVGLADSLPRNGSTHGYLVDVSTQFNIYWISLDGNIELEFGLLRLGFPIEKEVELVLQISDNRIFDFNFLFESLHIIEELINLILKICDGFIPVQSRLLLLMEEHLKVGELFLGLLDLVKDELFFSRENFDLLLHAIDGLLLLVSRLILLVQDFILFANHLVELVHTALVELDVLVYVHLVTVHDVIDAV